MRPRRVIVFAPSPAYDCPWCWGRGTMGDGKKHYPCPYCKGTGKQ